MTKTTSSLRKPRVRLTPEDYDRLIRLARSAENVMPDVAEMLVLELDRAHVLKGRPPADVVRMGCMVEYRDESSGQVQKIVLVYPEEADIAQGRVSVLTPIGAALIGLSAGDSMNWQTRTGSTKRLTILAVGEPVAA